jgi:A/G-specific adenine glycosylase
MPWRGHPSPYAVWVSEIMLQQTQVDTVRPFFARFMKRFPSLRTLARADDEAVLKAWEGLGYYARARNLLRAARMLADQPGDAFPRRAVQWAELPGVGAYTAAAVASICFGERVPVVDGNVARLLARLRLLNDDFRKPAARATLATWLQPVFDKTASAGDLNQAMMELGALVCRPRNPDCACCPLAKGCGALRKGAQSDYPKRAATAQVPERRVVATVVRRGGRILMTQRAATGLLGGFWELPGGVIETGETDGDAAQRWVRSLAGLEIETPTPVGMIRHAFSHFTLHLQVMEARKAVGRLAGAPHERAARWLSATEQQQLPVATAHRRALALRHPSKKNK